MPGVTDIELMWRAFEVDVHNVIEQTAHGVRTAMRNRHRAEKVALSKRHRFLLAEWYRVVERAQPEHTV